MVLLWRVTGSFPRSSQIVVHQVVLDGIATPYPTVALDAVDKEFTGSKVHGVCSYFPDAVQLFVIAFE